MFPRTNQFGFNLFTALISFLLIMLSVLLIQSMIQTERGAVDTIAKIESRSKLEAMAETARADAMQVFNYALRKKIEDWLVDEDTGVVQLSLQDTTWEEIQQEFAESKFGGESGSQFAFFTAKSLEAIFNIPPDFGNYSIDIEGVETLEAVLATTVAKSLDDFFTVIECEHGDPRDCEKGTFYVNLHLERLTQEEYEQLPKISVRDKATGEELKLIILPKTTFRIFVPLRFFKAIAEARALTHYPQGSGDFEDLSWVNTSNDAGLFAPKHHNQIEKMALGTCDFGSCAPRKDPLIPMASGSELDGGDQFCSGDNTAPKWGDGLSIELESSEPWFPASLTSYDASGKNDWRDMKDSMIEIAKAKACSVIKEVKSAGYLDPDPGDKFSLVGRECERDGEMLAYDIGINVDARNSTLVGSSGSAASLAGNPGRDLGLYRDGLDVEYPRIGLADLDCSGITSNPMSKCAEVKSVKVTLAFEEQDTNYMVRETKAGEQRIYRIAVLDNTYVPFTANWEQGSWDGDYLYGKPPQTTGCSLAEGMGWHCITLRGAGSLGNPPVTDGCQPG